MIGFAIDAIIWIIPLEFFVIFAICLGMKINIIIQIWGIVHKILYEKYNYIENPKRNNIEQNYGFGIQKNNRNDLYKMQNNNNINQNNKYNNNGNKNINRKNNNKNEKMNHPRIKTGGGRANQLRKKFGFN